MDKNYIQKYFKKIGFHLNSLNEKDFLALVKLSEETSRKKKKNNPCRKWRERSNVQSCQCRSHKTMWHQSN